VVSIFVNRIQFGPKEDFERYPRTAGVRFENDKDAARRRGVRALRARNLSGAQTSWSSRPTSSTSFEGAFRPGHFRGVATVVMKLFTWSAAHRDFRARRLPAVLVLRDMVKQLALPSRSCPRKRCAAGRARAQLQERLSLPGRARRGARLYQTLRTARDEVLAGQSATSADRAAGDVEPANNGWRPTTSREKASDLQAPGEEIASSWCRRGVSRPTRLIDNVEVTL